ncbi:hypothetical protein FRC12_024814, partial [Ceratobasidium sp. 428]
ITGIPAMMMDLAQTRTQTPTRTRTCRTMGLRWAVAAEPGPKDTQRRNVLAIQC